MPDQMDPLAEASGRVLIAAGRMDGAVGVLVGYALGDRSGRIMPGSLDALIRWWGDHIARQIDMETRSRHRAARNEAVQLGRERDELIHGIWTRAEDQVAQSNIPSRRPGMAAFTSSACFVSPRFGCVGLRPPDGRSRPGRVEPGPARIALGRGCGPSHPCFAATGHENHPPARPLAGPPRSPCRSWPANAASCT